MYLLNKEIKNLLRHQRTWWLLAITFFGPFLVFFLLFRFTGLVISSQLDTNSEQVYKVAWVAGKGQAEVLARKLKLHLHINLVDTIKESRLQTELERDSIDLGIVISPDFDSAVIKGSKAKITLHYLRQGGGGVVSIVQGMIRSIKDNIVSSSLDSLGVSASVLSPIQVTEQNYFDLQSMIDNLFKRLQGGVSGLLALLLLIFGATGARYGLRKVFLEELQQGQLLLLRSTAVSEGLLFSVKSTAVVLFTWISMALAVLGFAAALSYDHAGIMQNAIVQFRDLASWSNLILLVFSALPFTLLLLHSWTFWSLIVKENWAGFLSNVFLLFLMLAFLISMLVVPDFNITTALLPYLNYVFLCFGILTATYSFANLLTACVLTLVLAFLLAWVNFRLWKGRGMG